MSIPKDRNRTASDTEPRSAPKAQEIYRHFKGNLYQIVTLAKHSETGEQLVIYQALYGDFTVYARPLTMFMDKVDRVKYPQETQEYRFELQDLASLPDTTLENRPDREPLSGAGLYAAQYREGTQPERTEAEWENEAETKMETKAEIAGESGAAAEEEATDAVRPEEVTLDPLVLAYLDADSYEERLNILAGLHHRITDDMINVMAVATNVEISSGDIETRYTELRECLKKLQKYECSRLR